MSNSFMAGSSFETAERGKLPACRRIPLVRKRWKWSRLSYDGV